LQGSISHDGSWSVPFYFYNTGAALYSEATLPFDPPQDWAAAGFKAITLFFHGRVINATPAAGERMYVKLNDAKVFYDGDMADITEPKWHPWYIDLADFDTTLDSVTTITLGFDRGARDVEGIVFFDEIKVCIRRCILDRRDPSFVTFDYVDDCVVDYKEVEMMAGNWLVDTDEEPVMVPVTIPNPSFENQHMAGLEDGFFGWMRTSQAIWRFADPHGNAPEDYYSYLFIWNPGLDAPINNWSADAFAGVAADGKQVVVVRYDHNADGGGCAQLLTEKFDHTREYQLTVEVGNADAWKWVGYRIQLIAGGTNENSHIHFQHKVTGGTLLAEDENSVTIAPETFETVTVTYTPNSADADLDGLPLQIRLMGGLSGYAIYDDVKLFRSSEPLLFEQDLYEDMKIDFKDFALLAERFLEENGMFP
jgi:hypothetical protein